MTLTEKEKATLKDLQTQEKCCIEKCMRYAEYAKDQVLVQLFNTLKEDAQKHHESLIKVMNGEVPNCDCNDCKGKTYNPTATYGADSTGEDKNLDCFLATDCIGTAKLSSIEYNSDVFGFENPDIRKLLADIQIEEQNHAEMLYKYKKVNAMP